MKRYPQCILGTCCVPWKEDNSFAEDIFRQQLRFLLREGTRNLYIFGSAGEGYAVTDAQFEQITGVFCEEMFAAGAEPMVGVISASLPTVTARIKWATSMGVRQFQISLPCWGKCSFDEVRKFFAETCGQFNDCSFLHYNTLHTKRFITADEYGILADEFSNFVATKNIIDSVCDVTTLLTKSPQIQHFFMEYGFALASLLDLEAGWIVAPASCNWATAKEFYQACISRNREEIARLTVDLVDIQNILFECVGNEGHMDGTYDKIYCKVAYKDFPLRLLPPYSYVSDETFNRFVELLINKYPHYIHLSPK